MGFLSDLFGNTNSSQKRAYANAMAAIDRTRQQTDPFYGDLLSGGSAAQAQLADFLGLNGPAAQQAAYAGYSSGPGFQAELDAGTRAIDQAAGSRGMAFSGDTLNANREFGQNLFDNRFQGHLRNLSGMRQGGLQGAQGLMGNTQQFNQAMIGRAQAADQGRQQGLSNLFQGIGTIGGLAVGLPPGMFSGNFGSPSSGGWNPMMGWR